MSMRFRVPKTWITAKELTREDFPPKHTGHYDADYFYREGVDAFCLSDVPAWTVRGRNRLAVMFRRDEGEKKLWLIFNDGDDWYRCFNFKYLDEMLEFIRALPMVVTEKDLKGGES